MATLSQQLAQQKSERRRNWDHTESYTCALGFTYRKDLDDWVAKVNIDGEYFRLTETYVSAQAAMAAIERTWEREMKKRGLL